MMMAGAAGDGGDLARVGRLVGCGRGLGAIGGAWGRGRGEGGGLDSELKGRSWEVVGWMLTMDDVTMASWWFG